MAFYFTSYLIALFFRRSYKYIQRMGGINTIIPSEDSVDHRESPQPLNINGSVVSTVESLKFLGTIISRNLKWERNAGNKAQQSMVFLSQLKKFNLPQKLMMQFYAAIFRSILP